VKRFVDRVEIVVEAGRGGDGCVSFRREKYVPRGGPDGGDGGQGGDVVLEVDQHLMTLLDLTRRRRFKAGDGRPGQGKKRHGKRGKDLTIQVPPGTVVHKKGGGEAPLCELTAHGERRVVAKGGRGGKGNARYATSVDRAPRRSQPGKAGESRDLVLELKLIAEVGIIGFPNVGKSTLLARISGAHPKIADYPFTTRSPNLGVATLGEFRTVVMADIPGLVVGAHKGKGLGHEFLRHIERTELLVVVLDASGDPGEEYRALMSELGAYKEGLLEKRQVIAINKIDLLEMPSEEITRGLPSDVDLFQISALTGEGIERLKKTLQEQLEDR
jgi:GTP-binding protein